MTDPASDGHLARERARVRAALAGALAVHLERLVAAGLAIARAIDRPHRAVADRFDDDVAPGDDAPLLERQAIARWPFEVGGRAIAAHIVVTRELGGHRPARHTAVDVLEDLPARVVGQPLAQDEAEEQVLVDAVGQVGSRHVSDCILSLGVA